jgi:calcium-dependent protein kinase
MSDFTFKHVFTAANPGLLDDFYAVSKDMLGEGSYGQVAKGTNKATGAVRAIKAINHAKIKDKKRFQDEISIQMDLDHPNIVKLYETFQDARKIYLVMELCTGGELFDRIVEEAEKHEGSAFGEKDVARYMTHILGAIQYLHSKKYAHRDIKPENFLLQNKKADAEIKVIDFGLAKYYGDGGKMTTKAGTPYYVAPQVLIGEGYDEKCDIWSIGVICYILTCGYPPFYGDDDRGILRSVKKGSFDFPSPDWDKNSKELKHFIKTMLTMDPAERPSACELFSHPWMLRAKKNDLADVRLDMGLAAKMKNFRFSSKLKKVVLTMIAQNLKDSELEELRANFIALDKNNDGTLSKQELLEGMRKAKIPMPEDFGTVVDGLDTDGSQTIDYSEFLASTLAKKHYLREDAAWSAFRMFDKDGDGQITKDELFHVINDLKVSEEMLREVDTDASGAISFEEFKVMLERENN